MPPEISDKEGVPVAQKCMSHIFFFFFSCFWNEILRLFFFSSFICFYFLTVLCCYIDFSGSGRWGLAALQLRRMGFPGPWLLLVQSMVAKACGLQ